MEKLSKRWLEGEELRNLLDYAIREAKKDDPEGNFVILISVLDFELFCEYIHSRTSSLGSIFPTQIKEFRGCLFIIDDRWYRGFAVVEGD